MSTKKKVIRCIIFLVIIITAGCADKSEIKPCIGKIATPIVELKYESKQLTIVWNKVHDPEFELFELRYKLTKEDRYALRGEPIDSRKDTLIMFGSYYPGTKYQVILSVLKQNGDKLNCDSVQVLTTPCQPFNYVGVSGKTSTSATITWLLGSVPSDFNLFTVNLKKQGSSDVILNSTDQHQLKLTSLQPATDYEVQLVYTCTDNQVYLTDWIKFTTN